MKIALAPVSFLVVVSIALSGCSGSKGAQPGKDVSDSGSTHVKTGCDRFFFKGTEPVITKASLSKGLKRLCYRSYASAFSPVSRTAMWSAEVIDRTTVRAARQLERKDEFHPEPRLSPPPGTKLRNVERAELVDYRGSGYDRGHLAPSGDMPTRDSQAESFSLVNIVPQAPRLNRGSWSELESDIRDQVFDVPRVYILTGPLFHGKNVSVINERVMIPSHIWKAILIPDKGAAVYIASNTDYPVWKTMSVAQFSSFSGINPFPNIPEQFAKANMAAGEKPGKDGKNGKSGSSSSGASNTRADPWNPRNCNAPWRPKEDPHYGHCHPVLEEEAKYGLTPGSLGANNSQSWSSGGSAAGSSRAAAATGTSSRDDGADRLRARNRDRIRDSDNRR